MSKGSKKSERAGDDTRARIDDLKDGWSLGDSPSMPAEAAVPEKKSSVPEPKFSEGMSLPALPKPAPVLKKSTRAKGKTAPPPTPRSAKRAKSVSAPPPIPGKQKSAAGSPRSPKTPAPKKQALGNSHVPANVIVEPGAIRDDDPTLHRAESISDSPSIEEEELMIPAASDGAEDVDEEAPTRVSESYQRQNAVVEKGRKEEDVDEEAPTRVSESFQRQNAVVEKGHKAPALVVKTESPQPRRAPLSLAQLPDTIPRKSGVTGDIAYLFRVLGKRREARREIETLAVRITAAKEVRHGKLIDMAKLAVGDDAFDQTMVGRARTSLLEIEDKRSQHAGRIAAVDEKLGVLARSRDEREDGRVQKRREIQLEIDAVLASMEPLKQKAAAARKRAAALKRHLQTLDRGIRSKETSTVAVAGPADQASVNAEIASLKAERDAVASDQPAIVADIDHVEPQIAKLRASRDALQQSIEKLEVDKVVDAERIDEKVTALKAGRVVEDRLVKDQTTEKEARLLELGEEMHKKPPQEADLHAKGLERQDLEIAALESRRIELKDLLLAVEQPAMIRGGVWIAAAVVMLIALVVLLIAL